MSTAPVQETTPALVLLIMSGPDKGVSYRLVSSKISIGRDADNDIVLNDQRCSRHHVLLTVQNNQIIAKDVGSRSGIYINGKKYDETLLQLNQQFQIGDTLLSLRWTGAEQQNPIETRGTAPLNKPYNSTAVMGGAAARGSGRAKNDKIAFYGVVALVAVILFLVIKQAPKTNAKNYGIRTDQQIDTDIQNTQQRKDEIFREKMAQGVFSNQAGEAQAAYIQGFRDFRESNYGRAIQSFTAALALNPEHQLAQKYKRLAEKKLDESVQENMLEGKRHYDQNRFELARAAYRTVLILLNDPNNKTYLEAKERLQEVELLLKGRY